MARVGPGTYRPLFPPSPREAEIAVRAFRLDREPVTNGAFLAFVTAHPEWRRDRVPPVFADEGYLAKWGAPDALGPEVDPRQPVVGVSWFTARAYCASRDLRLPSEAEWELAAMASETKADASRDPKWRAELVAMYSRPTSPRLPLIGLQPANYWGVRDLHGLVWEWVLDFDATMLADDGQGADRLRFCGGGAEAARDKTDFPAFERVAFRSSLRARFTTDNLGFRCAGDLDTRGAR